MQTETRERIHHIWDQLADYPASKPLEALQFLLEEISQLINSDHSYWLSAIRLKEQDASSDMMRGWRPGPIFYYKELPANKNIYNDNVKKIDTGSPEIDESTLNHVKQAGRFRATLLRDHVSPAFFDTDHHRTNFKACNITDTLFVVAAVNADTEIYFCFNRIGEQPQFEKTELEIASYALRSLNWFHKRVLLNYGLLIADNPLSPTEKKIINLLLTDLSEKQIADKLQQKADTTHKHILKIYRKFNVNSRAALMAIWLGH